VEAGLLPGITRKHIIQIAEDMGIPVTQSTIMPNDLASFDGAFVTNSVIEMLSVESLGETKYEISDMVETLYHAYCHRMNNTLFSL
jgi:branched-subunit amino acid aminotransferase/4-amino-4-deoxychorismate lyase